MTGTAQYRWPKKGDRLLRSSTDWDRGVEFMHDDRSRHVQIWNGFMSAAGMLIDASPDVRSERHALIYPILFNYRHAIELAMKWVIIRYGRYANVDNDGMEHHDLWQIWKTCRQIIVEVGGEDEAIATVEQVIKDFHDLDKAALAFRYPRDKNGALIALPDGMIDRENIRDVMEGVAHFFDGVDEQLDAHTSAAP